jgi:hypothetical protein
MLVIMRLSLAALAALWALLPCASAAADGMDQSLTPAVARVAVPAAAQTAQTGGWLVAARIAVPGRSTYLESISAAGAGDVWSAGVSAAQGGRTVRLLIERKSGGRWRPVAVPEPLARKFQAGQAGRLAFALIRASSAGNVWVFNQETGAFLRWDGRQWSEGSVPAPPGDALAVTSALVLGHCDVWAFGATVGAKGGELPFAARFSGHSWHVVSLPRTAGPLVSAASAASRQDIWVTIGFAGQLAFPASGSGGSLLHWNGRRWEPVPLPAVLADGGDPTSVVAVSDHDVWVGGGAPDLKPGGLAGMSARWNGRTWHISRLPQPASSGQCVLSSILPGRRAGLLALDLCFAEGGPSMTSQFWDLASGHWTGPARPRLTGPAPVLLSMSPAGPHGTAWAAGFAGEAAIVAVHALRQARQ